MRLHRTKLRRLALQHNEQQKRRAGSLRNFIDDI
jgi:hypothetical protein